MLLIIGRSYLRIVLRLIISTVESGTVTTALAITNLVYFLDNQTSSLLLILVR